MDILPFTFKHSINFHRKELHIEYKKNQNHPITVKYPEMLARMAPNFVGEELPVYGKEGLWFFEGDDYILVILDFNI